MRTRPILVILSWLLSTSAFAVPYDLSYGGRLTEASGRPVVGPVNLRVALFRSETGTDQVAVNIPDFMGVALADGLFQIKLSLTPAEFHVAFNETDAVWVQVTDVTHGVTYPRQKFSAVPYALKVPVDGKSLTYNVDGQLVLGTPEKLSLKALNTSESVSLKAPDNLATSRTFTLPGADGTSGQFLRTDGAGNLSWAGVGGGGDLVSGNNLSDLVSAAAARTNLGLGSLATKSAVGSSDITDGGITDADIADGTITDADINATAGISYLKISGLGSAASKRRHGSR